MEDVACDMHGLIGSDQAGVPMELGEVAPDEDPSLSAAQEPSANARRSETCSPPSTITARNTSTPPFSKASGGTCNASKTGAFLSVTAYP